MLTVINVAARDAHAPGHQREVAAWVYHTHQPIHNALAPRLASTRTVTTHRQPRPPVTTSPPPQHEPLFSSPPCQCICHRTASVESVRRSGSCQEKWPITLRRAHRGHCPSRPRNQDDSISRRIRRDSRFAGLSGRRRARQDRTSSRCHTKRTASRIRTSTE